MLPQPEFARLRRTLGRVGVLTGSRRANYLLTEELRRRGIISVLLLPSETIPLDIRVVIASKELEKMVPRLKLVTWMEESSPQDVVDRAVYVLNSGDRFEEASIGVDPGKEIGVAVVADGKVLKTDAFKSVDRAVEEVLRQLSILPCSRKVVRIGSGAEDYGSSILSALKLQLPCDVEIQKVEEWGTTKDVLSSNHKRSSRNAASAARIALRQKRPRPRGA
jgi:hypothetical protein